MVETTPRITAIACAVLEQETRHFARQNPHVTVRILEQGLHDRPDRLRQALREAVDAAEAEDAPEAIVLVYGLCSRGVEGVCARRSRLVIPRAHDCITLLLGSRRRYSTYVAEHPGTYWYSPGWIATGHQPGQERYEAAYARYREQYDEDDAEYLMQIEQNWMREYDRAAYVDLGLSDAAGDVSYTQRCAEWLGWSYDRLHGESRLLHDLLTGPWDSERFLVLQPGQSARFVDDDRIMVAVAGATMESTCQS